MSLVPMPSFALEMGLPQNRAKVWFSVRAGYLITSAFVVLTAIGGVSGLMAITPGLGALIALKFATNTALWIALRRDRYVIETGGLNVLADILAMTGAIYATGGVTSPLLPIYGVELTVLALLTNVGVTIATSTLTFLSYAAMLGMIRFGVLATPASIVSLASATNDTYLVVALIFVAFVLGVPTAFAAAMLRQLREKEDALLARTQQLVEAGRQKSQFMANVTHELRTPIHGICGLADLVESGVYGPVTEKQQSAVRDMKGSALSLLRLIDDLLTLARDDAGKLEYRDADVDLDEVLASVIATVGFLRGTRALDVVLDVHGPLPVLRTDRGKLVQILVNLVANAVKFTPDGGRVTVRARALGGLPERVEIEVEDDGIGIPPDQLGRIFDEFRQVDGSRERRYGGAGLGLALVKRLTALLGGTVAVESALGEGSTFRVLLPVVGPPARANTGKFPASVA